MGYYDTLLFIQIIESVAGVQYLREDRMGTTKIMFYQGLKGKLVTIDVSEEDIPIINCKAYLEQLGLDDLISAIFPSNVLKEDDC